MKKNYLLILLTAFFCCFSLASTAMNKESRGTKEELVLRGNLESVGQRSLIKPIQAFVSEEAIEVDFNLGLGTIELSVYDDSGSAVYQESMTTYAGQLVYIDISSFNAGEYTIVFVNSQGQYLSGIFVIE